MCSLVLRPLVVVLRRRGTDPAFLRARAARGAAPPGAAATERQLLRQLAVHRYGFVPPR